MIVRVTYDPAPQHSAWLAQLLAGPDGRILAACRASTASEALALMAKHPHLDMAAAVDASSHAVAGAA